MDQGSQFTGSARITTLTEAGVRIPMDGRGRFASLLHVNVETAARLDPSLGMPRD